MAGIVSVGKYHMYQVVRQINHHGTDSDDALFTKERIAEVLVN